MDFEMVGVKREELSYQVACAAHSGTSFSPEERARQEREAYYEDIKGVYGLFADRITPGQEAVFLEEINRYRRANLSRRLDYLRSRSRVLSAMITGPAKFPTRRNEKRSRAYENKVSAFAEWRKKAIYRIGKTLGLSSNNSISSDEKDAIEQLQAKIDQLEARQARMKEINGIWRKGGNKPEPLREANLAGAERDEIVSHIKYGIADRPYPSWSLTNNNANIRRLKERLREIRKRQADQTTDTELNGIRIVDNVEDNRVQVFFPGKPSEAIRSELKRNGFKWAPSIGAWQRMRSREAMRRAKEIISRFFQQQGE